MQTVGRRRRHGRHDDEEDDIVVPIQQHSLTRVECWCRNNHGLLELNIHDACQQGDLQTVKTMLDKNPELKYKRDQNGRTPLWTACKALHKDVVAYILEHGADPNVRDKPDSDPDGTPLIFELACCSKYGYDQKKLFEIAKLIMNHPQYDREARNFESNTPLHYVCDPEWAKMLLERGDDVNAHNRYGDVPLHYHIDDGKTRNFKFVQFLLTVPNIDVNAENNDGFTPLHTLCSRAGHDALLDLYFDVVDGKEPNWTGQMARLLVQHGADVYRNPNLLRGRGRINDSIWTNPKMIQYSIKETLYKVQYFGILKKTLGKDLSCLLLQKYKPTFY